MLLSSSVACRVQGLAFVQCHFSFEMSQSMKNRNFQQACLFNQLNPED